MRRLIVTWLAIGRTQQQDCAKQHLPSHERKTKMTPRAKEAAEIAAKMLRDQGFQLASASQVWEPGKDGLKPRLRIGAWKILRDQHGMSLTQIVREATPKPEPGAKRYHHTTIMSGLRRYNHYYGEGLACGNVLNVEAK